MKKKDLVKNEASKTSGTKTSAPSSDALLMDKELFAEALLGKEAESFIQSNIGQYLVGCAEQEASEAMHKLATVFPWRRRKIQELQNQIWRAQSIQSWLGELIIKGHQAVNTLEESE